MRRPLIVTVACAVLMVGCSAGEGTAAGVTCSDFNQMSIDDQKQAVRRVLEERGDADRSELQLVRTKLRISSGCLTPDNRRTRIGDLADLGKSPQFLHER